MTIRVGDTVKLSSSCSINSTFARHNACPYGVVMFVPNDFHSLYKVRMQALPNTSTCIWYFYPREIVEIPQISEIYRDNE